MAEYDSDGVNVGAAVRLWKHLSMHAFTHDLLAYRVVYAMSVP